MDVFPEIFDTTVKNPNSTIIKNMGERKISFVSKKVSINLLCSTMVFTNVFRVNNNKEQKTVKQNW
jgi:hypothetical protein